MLDKKLFAALLGELAAYHNRKINGLAQRVWYKTLGHLTPQQFEQAIEAALARCEFMPTPEQVAEFAGVGLKHRILEYWERINQGRKALSVAPGDTKGYDNLIASMNLDEVALKTLKTLGGLTALSNLNDQDLKWTRDKFIEYYELWDAKREELHEEAELIRVLKAQSEVLALPPSRFEPIPEETMQQMAELFASRKMPEPEPAPTTPWTTKEYRASYMAAKHRLTVIQEQESTSSVVAAQSQQEEEEFEF